MKTENRLTLLLLTAALLLPVSSFSQVASGETIGGVTLESIEAVFAEYDSDSAPGCAVSVYLDGRMEYSRGFGISNLDYGISLSDSSSFYMASVSKHVTAAAAGLLVIRGELDEDAFVQNYIEDWPEYAENVTVGQLFSHTSGLPDIYGLMSIAGISTSNPMDLEDYMDVIRNGESLMFEPGSEYSYTNSGYTTLAYLVEKITGKGFPEFAEAEFFEPFGMKSTHFHDNRFRIVPNRVISYTRGGGHFRRSYLGNFQGVGPGGLYSTLKDWERWESFWYGNLEWERGISIEEASELKKRMTTSAIAGGEAIDYGWGLHLGVRKGAEIIGHGGSFMGFKTDYRRYPAYGVSFVTLCNRGDANPQDLNHELADLFLKDRFETFLAPYQGIYRNDELPIEYKLTVEDGNLKLNRRLSPNGFMNENDKDSWQAGSWNFRFERDEEGGVSGFTVSTGRALDVEFKKTESL